MLNEQLISALSKVYPRLTYVVGEVTDELTGLSHTVSRLSYQAGSCRMILAEGFSSHSGDEARIEAHRGMLTELKQVMRESVAA